MKDLKFIGGVSASFVIFIVGIYMSFIHEVKSDDDVNLVWIALAFPIAGIIWHKYVANELKEK